MLALSELIDVPVPLPWGRWSEKDKHEETVMCDWVLTDEIGGSRTSTYGCDPEVDLP